MKKISFVLAVILILSCFVGCTSGSYVAINSQEQNTPYMMSMTYESFDGNKKTTIDVEENQIIVIKAEIITESGELDIEIENKDNDEDVFSADDVKTSEFTITLQKEGKYTLEVDADHHQGSYCFTW